MCVCARCDICSYHLFMLCVHIWCLKAYEFLYFFKLSIINILKTGHMVSCAGMLLCGKNLLLSTF